MPLRFMYKKKHSQARTHQSIRRMACQIAFSASYLRNFVQDESILMEVLLVVDLLAILGLPQLPNRMKVRRITQDYRRQRQ